MTDKFGQMIIFLSNGETVTYKFNLEGNFSWKNLIAVQIVEIQYLPWKDEHD